VLGYPLSPSPHAARKTSDRHNVAAGWIIGEFNPCRSVKARDGDFATATSKLVQL
jgi:hypothetical protein